MEVNLFDTKSRLLFTEGSLDTKYDVGNTVGQGAFGTVKLAIRKSDNQQVVVKQINTACMSEKERTEAKKEVTILAQFDHANIIKYLDCVVDGEMLCIVMEFAEEGELYTMIRDADGKPFTEDQIMFWFVQICVALQHVHAKNMLHRDLKSQNIFRTKNNILKLGDFGIAKVLNSESQMAHTAIGTPYYLSPEICEDQPYGPKSDVWALGCILYEMCSLKRAFDGQSLPALVMKILRGKFPAIPFDYSSSLKDLVNRLLQRKPAMRPSIKEILNMEYVRPHMEKYFETVGSLMGIAPDKLRAPSARHAAAAKGAAGKVNKLKAGRGGKKGLPPAAPSAAVHPDSSRRKSLSESDALHEEFLAELDRADEDLGEYRDRERDRTAEEEEEEPMYDSDFELYEEGDAEPRAGTSTTSVYAHSSRARPGALEVVGHRDPPGRTPGAPRAGSRKPAASPITAQAPGAMLKLSDPKLTSAASRGMHARHGGSAFRPGRPAGSHAAQQRELELERMKRERAQQKAAYNQARAMQELQDMEERRRRQGELAQELASKQFEKDMEKAAASQQMQRHKTGLKAAKATLDRSKLKDLGKQFAEKQNSGSFGSVTVTTPKTPGSRVGTPQLRVITPKHRDQSGDASRQRLVVHQTSSKRVDVPVEIFCPLSSGTSRMQALPPEDSKVASMVTEDRDPITSDDDVHDASPEDDCTNNEDDELINTELLKMDPDGCAEEDDASHWTKVRELWRSRNDTDMVSVLTQMSTLLDGNEDDILDLSEGQHSDKQFLTGIAEVPESPNLSPSRQSTAAMGKVTHVRSPLAKRESSQGYEASEHNQIDYSEQNAAARIEVLRTDLEEKLGDDLLLKVYRYLRDQMTGSIEASDEDTDVCMQEWLNMQLGPSLVQHAKEVFRLIMCEDNFYEHQVL